MRNRHPRARRERRAHIRLTSGNITKQSARSTSHATARATSYVIRDVMHEAIAKLLFAKLRRPFFQEDTPQMERDQLPGLR
jgi:hypothetical protein